MTTHPTDPTPQPGASATGENHPMPDPETSTTSPEAAWTDAPASPDAATADEATPGPISSAGPASGAAGSPSSGNFVVRHWRGELPLWVSYWVIGFAGNMLGRVVVAAIGGLTPLAPLRPEHALVVAFVATWVFALVFTAWQAVGIWRSATRYVEARRAAGRRTIWGTLAKAATVLACVGTGTNVVRQAVPEAANIYEIAVLGDPAVEDFTIRVMRGGSEAEFHGGIRLGATEALRAVLHRNPGVHVLHINSGGGRFIEAQQMAELIRARGLSTYVAGVCASACTLVFPAGRERWLAPEATLGFHTPDFGLLAPRDEVAAVAEWRDALVAAGYRPAFVDRGLEAPFEDMWYPTREELAQSGVTFRDADGSQFAVSGYGGSVSRADFETIGEDIPAYAVLLAKTPAAFAEAADVLVAAFDAGKTDTQLPGIVRAAIGPALVAQAPEADDEALLDYAYVSTAILREIRDVSPGLCFLAATDGDFDVAGSPYVDENTRVSEWQTIEAILATAEPRPAVSDASLSAAVTRLEAVLAVGLDPERRALLSAPVIRTEQEDDACAAILFLGEAMDDIPPDDAAAILRRLTRARANGQEDDGLPPVLQRLFLVP